MAQYQVVDHFRVGLGATEMCIIERVVSGEMPIQLRFEGSRAKAQIEADRLNGLAKKPKRV